MTYYLENNAELCKKLTAVLKTSAADGGIKVGSMCTGWGVAEMVLHSINTAAQLPQDGPKAWDFYFLVTVVATHFWDQTKLFPQGSD